ncbi:replicative DNA helicase [candidate division KSB1 bacterium]|nr:replicative DNA helicase [candidate division KSB1 bacterium]
MNTDAKKTPQIQAAQRVPPQALDAEMSVLGAMLIDNDVFPRILEILDESCFYKAAHQKIFNAAIRLFEKNEPIDVITIANQLQQAGELDALGGSYYLTQLAENIPSAANAEYYAKIVLDKALLRKLIGTCTEVANESYEGQSEAYDLIDKAEQKIFTLRQNRARSGFISISPILHQTFDAIDKYSHSKSGLIGVPTGFRKLDDMLSGFQRSDLIIIAGRPSMGKTALALNVARNAAVMHRIPVGIFSLEMANHQLAMRMLCSEAKVDSHKLRTGRLSEDEWPNLSMKVGVLAEAPIFIDDTPAINVLEIRAKSRRLKVEHDVGLLIVDYLQLAHGTGRFESRQIEISQISQSLKALAKEIDVPVVALSQLSRAVESRPDKRPQLSDLRESGAIEQDADVVMFIYRPEVYGLSEEPGIAEIIVGKQRNGPTGAVKVAFKHEYLLFTDLAPEYYDEEEAIPSDSSADVF